MTFYFDNSNLPEQLQADLALEMFGHPSDNVSSVLNTILREGNTEMVFLLLVRQGVACREKTDKLKLALILHLRALDLLPDLKKNTDNERFGNFQAVILDQVGYDYELLEELDQAITYYQKHLDIARATRSLPRELQSMGNIANIYKKQGKVDEAGRYYKYLLGQYMDLNDIENEIRTLRHLIILTRNNELHDECINYYYRILELVEREYQKQNTDILWEGFSAFFDIDVTSEARSRTTESDILNFWRSGLLKSIESIMSKLTARKKATDAIKYAEIMDRILSLK